MRINYSRFVFAAFFAVLYHSAMCFADECFIRKFRKIFFDIMVVKQNVRMVLCEISVDIIISDFVLLFLSLSLLGFLYEICWFFCKLVVVQKLEINPTARYLPINFVELKQRLYRFLLGTFLLLVFRFFVFSLVVFCSPAAISLWF